MSDILTINEEAYNSRYGLSLESIWSKLSEIQQKQYIKQAEQYNKTNIPEVFRFNEDEILRIIIGYINKEQLRRAFEGALPVTRVLLWEPDEAVFAAACIIEDLAQFIKDMRIYIALGRGSDILKLALNESAYEYNILHRHVYAYGKYLNPNNRDVELFLKEFERYYVDMVSEMKYRKQYEHLVYENFLYSVNVLSNNSTINQLFDSIPVRDIPVIIVAAGPSLIKNCTELNRARGKAIVVAVAHSMKTLENNNVRPDFVAVIDPRSPFFLEFDKEKDRNLICCVYADRVFQKEYNGKLIYFGFPMFKELFSTKRTRLEIFTGEETGSVATDILALFIAYGFRKFILVGQDLAYDEEGMSHTGGEKEIPEKNRNGIFPETEGIYGNIVKTRDDWLLFKQYYEKRIREDDTLNIVDATEGGALIQGTRIMNLKEAIDEYCISDYPVSEWIGNIQKGNKEEKEYIDDWFEQVEEMNRRTSLNLERIILLNEEIVSRWDEKAEWDDDFSAKCKRYDIMYHIVMEGEDGASIREYCRSDLERYIEDALIYEGDDNIEARMKREHELFLLLKGKLKTMEEYIRTIRDEILS